MVLFMAPASQPDCKVYGILNEISLVWDRSADLRICSAVQIWHGAVRIDAVWCGFHAV